MSPAAGGYASGVIGAGASWLGQLLGLDLKAGVDQPLDDDLGRGLRVRNREIAIIEQVGQHVQRG